MVKQITTFAALLTFVLVISMTSCVSSGPEGDDPSDTAEYNTPPIDTLKADTVKKVNIGGKH